MTAQAIYVLTNLIKIIIADVHMRNSLAYYSSRLRPSLVCAKLVCIFAQLTLATRHHETSSSRPTNSPAHLPTVNRPASDRSISVLQFPSWHFESNRIESDTERRRLREAEEDGLIVKIATETNEQMTWRLTTNGPVCYEQGMSKTRHWVTD